MTFLLSTIYPSALVIISLPTPTFHCMFTWLPSLLCISCAGGTKSERQRHPEQVEPCTDCPFTSEISVKREHVILIPVMRYFYFLIFVIRAKDPSPPLFTPLCETWHHSENGETFDEKIDLIKLINYENISHSHALPAPNLQSFQFHLLYHKAG